MSQEPARHGSASIENLKREMNRALERIMRDLDRLDILAAAMAGFSRPVPDYECGFQHLRHQTASVTELRNNPSL